MGFAKLGFFFLVLLFQLHLILTHQKISQENSVTEFDKQQKVHPRVHEKSAVSRRGASGGGHGSYSGHGNGNGGHGSGEESPHSQGGGSVIPFYAAGAAGGAHGHRDKKHHHGSNNAIRGHSGLNYLLCAIFILLVFGYLV